MPCTYQFGMIFDIKNSCSTTHYDLLSKPDPFSTPLGSPSRFRHVLNELPHIVAHRIVIGHNVALAFVVLRDCHSELFARLPNHLGEMEGTIGHLFRPELVLPYLVVPLLDCISSCWNMTVIAGIRVEDVFAVGVVRTVGHSSITSAMVCPFLGKRTELEEEDALK